MQYYAELQRLLSKSKTKLFELLATLLVTVVKTHNWHNCIGKINSIKNIEIKPIFYE